ncbi:MAG: M56 family metallopeptidase [Acidobacteriaceae bacterium]
MHPLAWGPWTVPLLDHLWQSTVFAGGVWLLALVLRHNQARMRYRLWMAASLKFLLPFSLLMALGARLPWPAHLDRTQPAIAAAVEGVTQPLLQAWPVETDTGFAASQPARHPATDWLPLALAGVWGCGTLLLLGRWTANWLRLRATVRRGESMTLADGTKALLMAENVEPGIFGILNPVLVLPRGIAQRLSAQQLNAIVAHEICHMRRRDNLTAALHMAVEALFWFHPLVWWLRTRLIEERERACDEAVLEATRQPFAYAEGILSVCRFYIEAPLSCVSGVTGSDLKQRIARILSGQAVRKLDLRRKLLLALAGVLAVGVPVTTGVVRAAQGQTQSPQMSSPAGTGISGTWQGTMQTPDGRQHRMVLRIAKDEKGALSGTLYPIDQNGRPLASSSLSFESGTLRFVNQFPGLTYEGRISADRQSISGTVTQNGSFPLVLERATPDTEWTIPAPPPRIPPMAADAHPTFEVATIKPSPPDARGVGLRLRGGELAVENLSLSDLMKFAWQVQAREIVGAPGWMATDKWDIEAKPDTPGMPSHDQLNEMIRKLLADRFALKLHEEKREMAAYVLTVGKDRPKLTRSADASVLGGFTMGPLGVMHAGGASMGDFTHVLQGDILDRPVVDRTGLEGRWDFTLQWMPDDTQFAGMKVPRQAADDANTLPPLFTAIQEQLGLKLESQKADVPVLVIDHVEHPSPN